MCRPNAIRIHGLLLLAGMLFPLAASAADSYLLRFSEDLTAVEVQACFEGEAPSRLYRHRQASRYTRWIRWEGGSISSADQSNRLRLPPLPQNACIEWAVDLEKAVAAGDYRLAMKSAGAVVSQGSLWFWRDTEQREIQVKVEIPRGWSFSTPWKRGAGDGRSRLYSVEATPYSWTSRLAVGRFSQNDIPVTGGRLRLAIIGEVNPEQREVLTGWMQQAANSVAGVFGAFPRSEPQVLVVASGRQGSPVPWAHVLRGGGMAAEFFVDEQSSPDQLADDWTATHELSHMLLPYVRSEDRWFSEGLASYYQNVLRARTGRLSEQAAWARLHSGFERGKAASGGVSLARATQSGYESIMRVYWSGAAMMLEADTQLRALSGGEQSLDTALAAFNSCCFGYGDRWPALAVFEQLDELTGYRVFTGLYDKHVPNTRFPDMSETYRQLGLEPDGRSMQFDSGAPWGRIRHFIMNDPGPGASAQSSSGSP